MSLKRVNFFIAKLKRFSLHIGTWIINTDWDFFFSVPWKYSPSLPTDFRTYIVICKVSLTSSNTVFGANAFVRQNHWILPNIWQVRFLSVSLNSRNIFCLIHINLISRIHLAGLLAKSWTRKLSIHLEHNNIKNKMKINILINKGGRVPSWTLFLIFTTTLIEDGWN